MWDLMRGKGVASTKLGKGMSYNPILRIVNHNVSNDVQKEKQFDGQLTVQNLQFNQVLLLTFMQLYVFILFFPVDTQQFQNMDSLYSITHPSRIHDIKFCSTIDKQSEVLLVGAEDGKVSVYGISKSSKPPFVIAEMVGHTNRFVHVSSGPKTFLTDIAALQNQGRSDHRNCSSHRIGQILYHHCLHNFL